VDGWKNSSPARGDPEEKSEKLFSTYYQVSFPFSLGKNYKRQTGGDGHERKGE
jgi:hypothetical protein